MTDLNRDTCVPNVNWTIELIRQEIEKLIKDHILQSALKDCDGNWLGNCNEKVVTCDTIFDKNKTDTYIESGIFNKDTHNIELKRNDGKVIYIPIPRNSDNNNKGDDIYISDIEYKDNELIITRNDGIQLKTTIDCGCDKDKDKEYYATIMYVSDVFKGCLGCYKKIGFIYDDCREKDPKATIKVYDFDEKKNKVFLGWAYPDATREHDVAIFTNKTKKIIGFAKNKP